MIMLKSRNTYFVKNLHKKLCCNFDISKFGSKFVEVYFFSKINIYIC